MSQKVPSPDESSRREEMILPGLHDGPVPPLSRWQRLLRHLLRPWHLFRIWSFTRRIRRQRRELAKYVRRSAYEIAAWKQDIRFLAEQREYHLHRAAFRLPTRPAADFKVIPLPESGSQRSSSSSQDSPRH